MNQQDKLAFAKTLAALGEYYGREISDGLISIYWNGLYNYDLAAIHEAINRHMRNPESGQFMPKIADMVKMLEGSTGDAALLAWTRVDEAVRRVGVYADVDLADAIAHRVITDMGGWIKIGSSTESEWPFVSKEFQARYRGYKSRGEIPDHPETLVGIANAYNNAHGHQLEQPRRIGGASTKLLLGDFR